MDEDDGGTRGAGAGSIHHSSRKWERKGEWGVMNDGDDVRNTRPIKVATRREEMRYVAPRNESGGGV
jgi:hypothetical protein